MVSHDAEEQDGPQPRGNAASALENTHEDRQHCPPERIKQEPGDLVLLSA